MKSSFDVSEAAGIVSNGIKLGWFLTTNRPPGYFGVITIGFTR